MMIVMPTISETEQSQDKQVMTAIVHLELALVRNFEKPSSNAVQISACQGQMAITVISPYRQRMIGIHLTNFE